jgi:hypothetical protein
MRRVLSASGRSLGRLEHAMREDLDRKPVRLLA